MPVYFPFRASLRSGRLFALLIAMPLVLATLPALQPTPATAQADAVAVYYAEIYDCPVGFDPAAGDAAAARTNCTTPLPGISMTLATNNPAYPGDTRQSNALGQVSWGDIPLGTAYSITQAIPNGYGDPWVNCDAGLDPDVPGSDVRSMFFQAPGGTMDMGFSDPALANYKVTGCKWFNMSIVGTIPRQPLDDVTDVPTGGIEPIGTGRVLVTKRYCPYGYELIDPYSDRSGACQLEGPEASFTLTDANGTSSSMTTNKSINPIGHFAQWTDVTAGTIRVTEEPIDGYVTIGVACIAVAEGVTPTSLENAWSPENGWAEYTLPEDYVVVCEWFNTRLPQGGDAGTVTISKEYCPAGYVPPDVGQPYNSNDCRYGGPSTGLAYSLTQGGQSGIPPDEADSSGAAWHGVSAGPLSIVETPPPMYETVAVYCDTDEGVDPNNPSAAAKPPPNRTAHDGNTLDWDLTEGYYLHCIWQNAPSEDAYGNVLIAKRGCPDDYDFTGKSLDDLLTDCAEHQTGVEFTLQHESGETTQVETEQTENGAIASYLELPPGQMAITESVLTGYYLARVYCASYAVGDDPALIGTDAYFPVTTLDDGIAFRLDPGIEVLCLFFDTPGEAGARQVGTVTLYKYDCPPGFAGSNPGQPQYAAYCYPAGEGVTFTISRQDQEIASGATNAQSQVSFPGISPGQFRLSELPREGFDPPRVFCSATLIETQTTGASEDMQVDNWGITYDFQPGYALECQWYNQPGATASTDPATVVIHKRLCPEDYVDAGQSLETLLDECSGAPQGVNFFLRYPGQPPSSDLPGTTDASGEVQWPGVTPGGIGVQEVPNQGYDGIALHCSYYVSATGSPNTYARHILFGSDASLFVPGGYTLDCYWFNYPYIEPAEIEIIKTICDPPYAVLGASREDVLFNCATPVQFVVFQALEGGNVVSYATTDASGSAVLTGITPGPLTLFELAISHQALKVYCGERDAEGIVPQNSWQELDISADSVEYQVQPGSRLLCYWVNEAVEYPSVIVHKYSCGDAALTQDPSIAELREACTSPVQGISFELTAEGTPETQTTDAEGNAFWHGVPEGNLTMRETNPAEESIPYVYCLDTTVGGEQVNDSQRLVENYTDEFHLDGGTFVECWWFNFTALAPAEEASPTPPTGNGTTGNGTTGNGTTGNGTTGNGTTGNGTMGTGTTGGGTSGGGTSGGGTGGTGAQSGSAPSSQTGSPTPEPDEPAALIITTYTCPEGYDLHDPETDPALDCTELTDDLAFTLIDPDEPDDARTETTGSQGEPGKVSFDDLVPGPWLLSETQPENTHTAFISTCESDVRAFQIENPFVPFAYAGPEWQIGVVIVGGETLECDWYNVPEAAVSILAFDCPGVAVNVAQCDVASEPVSLTFSPTEEDGDIYDVSTDDTGTAEVVMEPGTYAAEVTTAGVCLIDSTSFDENGNLVVEEGPVEVRIYTCNR